MNTTMLVQHYEDKYNDHLTIKELVSGFQEDIESGAVFTEFTTTNGGKIRLNIKPPYQREFVYSSKEETAVINSILHGYPINIMYWVKTKSDNDIDCYELLDGQQRTMSICRCCKSKFPFISDFGIDSEPHRFNASDETVKDIINNYKLDVYICDGSSDEKKKWFETINIRGLALTPQEIRNALYSSEWLTDAKKYFSNNKGQSLFMYQRYVPVGYKWGDYMDVVNVMYSPQKETDDSKTDDRIKGVDTIGRQKFLEIVLGWATDKYNRDNNTKISIDEYMGLHKNDSDALDLAQYYQNVMKWVGLTFPIYYDAKTMKRVDWGILYNEYHDDTECCEGASKRVEILNTLDITSSNKPKMFKAALSGDYSELNKRNFDDKDKKWAFDKQEHKCAYCGKEFSKYNEMAADHIVPWSKGGQTDRDNLQMLCPRCNGKKSNWDDQYSPFKPMTIYEKFNLAKYDKEHGIDESRENSDT